DCRPFADVGMIANRPGFCGRGMQRIENSCPVRKRRRDQLITTPLSRWPVSTPTQLRQHRAYSPESHINRCVLPAPFILLRGVHCRVSSKRQVDVSVTCNNQEASG